MIRISAHQMPILRWVLHIMKEPESLPASLARHSDLVPGLLRVLQQAVGLRAVLITGGVILFNLAWLDGLWLSWFMIAEALLMLAFVLWRPVQQCLGQWFLPGSLAWFLIFPMLERALIATFMRTGTITGLAGFMLKNFNIVTIWLTVPVVLAAWQYGQRGLVLTFSALTIEHILVGPLLVSNVQELGAYLLDTTARLAMIGLVGYVVTRLVNAEFREKEALVAANLKLAQHAATVEQLAESRERNRLSRELHDTLAHTLTGLSVQLQALSAVLTRDPQAAADQLRGAQSTVRGGLQETRRAIQALRASPLEELGLGEALRQLCHAQAERTGISFDCQIADVGPLNPLQEQAIYRVAEAALANVEQHAAATQVRIKLAVPDPISGPCLEVKDNGIGFDSHAVSSDRFGLIGMTERAALIGARCRVDSEPGQGTVVRLELPANRTPVSES